MLSLVVSPQCAVLLLTQSSAVGLSKVGTLESQVPQESASSPLSSPPCLIAKGLLLTDSACHN